MSGSNHTPGPWAVENPMGEDIGLWIVQDGLEARQWSCIAVVTDDEDGTARDEGGRFIGRNEQRANARLIAAAPDLLAVAREACAIFDANHEGEEMDEYNSDLANDLWKDEIHRKLTDAIAKAEGRALPLHEGSRE